jgi:hypothetical protein
MAKVSSIPSYCEQPSEKACPEHDLLDLPSAFGFYYIEKGKNCFQKSLPGGQLGWPKVRQF